MGIPIRTQILNNLFINTGWIYYSNEPAKLVGLYIFECLITYYLAYVQLFPI